MQVEYVDTRCSQLFQALVHASGEPLRTVHARLGWIALRGEHQPTLLPFGVSGKSFLLAPDVGPRSVDLAVALGLEIVQAFGVAV